MAKKVWKTDTAGIEFIKQWEGFKAASYLCSAGVWTIGHGTTKNVTVHGIMISGKLHKTITKAQAIDLLHEDVRFAENAVNKHVTAPLNQRSFNALVSFVYNVGAEAFRTSTLLKLLNKKDYDGAKEQFLVWVYADKKKLAGLVKRRKAEYNNFDATLGDDVDETHDIDLSDVKLPTIQKPLTQSRTVKAQTLQLASGGVVGTAGVLGATSEALQGVDLSGMSDTAYQAASVASSAGTLLSVFREHWAIIFIALSVIIIGAALWTLYAKISDRKAK